MTRHPIVQGALSIGWSLAAAKGFQNLLRRYLSDEWLFLDRRNTTGSMIRSAITDTESSHKIIDNTTELGWTQVLSFVVGQIVHMDVRLAVTIVILAVIAPLMPYFLGYGKESKSIATHLDPAQRALLQFGKSKSEPILIGFMSMELDHDNPIFECAPHLRSRNYGNDLRKHIKIAEKIVERQEFRKRENTNQQEDRKTYSFSRSLRMQDSDVSSSGRPSSSTKSDYILPNAQIPTFGHKDSCVSHSKVWIQFPSFKTSNLDAQLTSEQVYSQPFIY